MPRTNNLSRSQGSRSKANSRNQYSDRRMNSMLQRLVLLNEAQTNRMIPVVPDIPKRKLPKDRITRLAFELQLANIVSNSTAPVTGAYAITLSGFPGYNSPATTFDSYRITYISINFVPFGITAAANATLGQLTTAIDYADASPVDQSQLLQNDTSMVVQTGQFFERRFVPRIAVAAYSGAFTSYAQSEGEWVDTSSPAVQYYGLKYSQSISSSANTGYSPYVYAIVEFKNND